MAVPPDSSAPPSSNAANKLPASSRKCCQYINAIFFSLSPYSISRPTTKVLGISSTEFEQIAFRPSQHLKHSAIFPTMITHQAMHTQTSLCSTTLLVVGLRAAK
jgi:hypothetical protein